MALKQIVLEGEERLEKEIRWIEKFLQKSPDGSLLIFRWDGRPKMYHRIYIDGIEKRTYLGKSKRKLASALARKLYWEQRLHDAKEELEAVHAFKKVFLRAPYHGKYLNQSRVDKVLERNELKELLGRQDLVAWAKEPYDKLDRHKEHLIHKGIDGENTRSKSEGIIRELLIRYNIPFKYDCAVIVNGNKIYVDFLIRHPKTGEYFIWEHFGRMDDPGYRKDIAWKMQQFILGGYDPMINLIITSENQKHPMSFYEADRVIRQFFLN